MTILLRLSAWTLAALVTFATLGPATYRPHAQLGQNGDHALAFVLVGLLFGLSGGANRRVPLLLLAWTGAIEILQFWAPGRHARLTDFVVDALATLTGFALATGGTRLMRNWRQRTE